MKYMREFRAMMISKQGHNSRNKIPSQASPVLPLDRIRSRLVDQSGVALLMVVFIVTILTAMVFSFIDTTQSHLHLTQYYKNRLQAYATAQSGLQLVVSLLTMDAALGRNSDGYDSPWNSDSPDYQALVAPLMASVVLCNSSSIQPALAREQNPQAEQGNAVTMCPIIDENRKISLYNLVNNLGQQREATNDEIFQPLWYLLQDLLTERDLAPTTDDTESLYPYDPGSEPRISEDQAQTLAEYLVDWIDTGNNSGPNNADVAEDRCPEDEADYTAKNGRLDSMDELALVCGFRQMPRHVIEMLGRHLTNYQLDTNINTATRPVLHAFCAACTTDGVGETYSIDIYDGLHPAPDQNNVPGSKTDWSTYYKGVLNDVNFPETPCLEKSTGVRSDVLRVGIDGVVFSTETGSIQASFGLVTVLRIRAGQAPGQALELLYYREK